MCSENWKSRVFKKYTGIFAISSKDIIGYEVYKKGGIDSNRMVDFINKFINGKYINKLIILDNAIVIKINLLKMSLKRIIIYYMLFHINIIQMQKRDILMYWNHNYKRKRD